jgi:hypothetical protein
MRYRCVIDISLQVRSSISATREQYPGIMATIENDEKLISEAEWLGMTLRGKHAGGIDRSVMGKDLEAVEVMIDKFGNHAPTNEKKEAINKASEDLAALRTEMQELLKPRSMAGSSGLEPRNSTKSLGGTSDT